jgi:serine O-acetyltransferase
MNKMSIRRLVRTLLIGAPSDRARVWLWLLIGAQKRGHLWAVKMASRRLQARGLFISPGANIGVGLRLPHPVAIVIGEGVEIAEDVTIFQSVTLGGRKLGDWKVGNYPSIGAGTVIFSGAVVVGKVIIGKNCVIGANSVVTRDIPDGATAVGAPARVVLN